MCVKATSGASDESVSVREERQEVSAGGRKDGEKESIDSFVTSQGLSSK